MNQRSLLTFLLAALTRAHANDETNLEEFCDLTPDGTQRTCIESTEFNGERCFYTKVPQCAGNNAPLVFDIHGYKSCPFYHSYYSGWLEQADKDCFVVVLPLGTTDPSISGSTCWGLPGGLIDDTQSFTSDSCCCDQVTDNDDVAFLRQVAAVLSRDIPIETSNDVTIDTKRIYMAGHSNGCMASTAMASTQSDLVAAVGCHSGTAVTPFPDTYSPTPLLMVHGTADIVVGYDINLVLGADTDLVLFGVQTAYKLISQINGCNELEEKVTLSNDTNNVTEYRSTSCTNNANVVLYAIDGVGHFPYTSAEILDLNEVGTVPTKIDTTQLAWDFMKVYSSEATPELIVYEKNSAPVSAAPVTAEPVSAAPSASTSASPSSSSEAASVFLIMITVVLLKWHERW